MQPFYKGNKMGTIRRDPTKPYSNNVPQNKKIGDGKTHYVSGDANGGMNPEVIKDFKLSVVEDLRAMSGAVSQTSGVSAFSLKTAADANQFS